LNNLTSLSPSSSFGSKGGNVFSFGTFGSTKIQPASNMNLDDSSNSSFDSSKAPFTFGGQPFGPSIHTNGNNFNNFNNNFKDNWQQPPGTASLLKDLNSGSSSSFSFGSLGKTANSFNPQIFN
jgi:hypothetical protein